MNIMSLKLSIVALACIIGLVSIIASEFKQQPIDPFSIVTYVHDYISSHLFTLHISSQFLPLESTVYTYGPKTIFGYHSSTLYVMLKSSCRTIFHHSCSLLVRLQKTT